MQHIWLASFIASILHQGLFKPEFYGDFVYKFKTIIGSTDFSDQFQQLIKVLVMI